MALRDIIEIDEEKCDGCGLCIMGCAEGALAIVEGKAKLVSEVYCDGLGACLAECPNDALKIVKREAVEFDEAAVEEHLAEQKAKPAPVELEPAPLACGCPGSMVRQLEPAPSGPVGGLKQASTLQNWPVQLHLVPPKAPFFNNANLLIAADCAGFSVTNLHRDFLPGKSLIIACPKLDDVSGYVDKMAAIFSENNIKSITILYMTVPCCGGLVHMVRQALAKSGRPIPLRIIRVDPTGQVVQEEEVQAA